VQYAPAGFVTLTAGADKLLLPTNVVPAVLEGVVDEVTFFEDCVIEEFDGAGAT